MDVRGGDDEEEPTIEEDGVREDMTKERGEEDQGVEVSLHSIAELTSPKAMCLRGFIRAQEVITVIDPGATHNFISSTLVERSLIQLSME